MIFTYLHINSKEIIYMNTNWFLIKVELEYQVPIEN